MGFLFYLLAYLICTLSQLDEIFMIHSRNMVVNFANQTTVWPTIGSALDDDNPCTMNCIRRLFIPFY